jgi:ATP-dependent RNA helicase DOB1
VKTEKETFDWGIIIGWKRKIRENQEMKIIIEVLLHISKDSKKDNPIPCREEEEGEMKKISISPNSVYQISSIKISSKFVMFPDNVIINIIQKTKQTFPEGLPLLDPIVDMGIQDQDFKIIIKNIDIIENLLHRHPLYEVRNKSNFILYIV